MTPAQRQALRPYRKKLQQALAEAAATATTPGNARTWFVPYLAAVLTTYRKLTRQSVNGKTLSKAVAKNPRNAFFKLLKSSNRDPKTRSRWAAALVHAYESNVSPEQLSKWLKKGGGVSGRAAELSKTSRGLKQTANQTTVVIATPSPQPNGSPQANDFSGLGDDGDEQLE